MFLCTFSSYFHILTITGIGCDYVISYPLIYFNIEDFEDAFNDIVINENEYFCIELFVMLPPQRVVSTGSLVGGERKVLVFQGAVNWDALAGTFSRQANGSGPVITKGAYLTTWVGCIAV